MINNQHQNVLPPLPPLRTPIYSGNLQIGVLDHLTKEITLFHSPYTYTVMSTEPGSYVLNHFGQAIGRLGNGGQLLRFAERQQ